MPARGGCLVLIAAGWLLTAAHQRSIADPPDVAVPVRVARFQGDRRGAISLTFDDGLRDQLELAVPVLDRLGFKATFFIIAGRTPETDEEANAKRPGDWGSISWPQIKALAAQGHEIGNHSWSHAQLTRIDDAALADEVNKSFDAIAAHLGTPPITFCYPGNGFDDRVKAAALERHLTDRESCFDFTTTTKEDGTNVVIDRAILEGKWIVSITHGILNGYGAYPSLKAFEGYLGYVKDREDRLWVDTCAHVFCYLRERDEAKLTFELSPGKAVVMLTSSLDAKIYNRPLTLVIAATGAKDVRAERAGVDLPVKVLDDCIHVDAVPADGPITITWR
ncbi:MAG TPA: polysaccharide deacetylase family protein [Pirellulales bacterium]|jgi:peptidoglycan/xylan/chitin deacetylase (PgdA/CDA1 family)